MKPLLHTIKKGGSGFGFHYYAQWAGCPRKATLDTKSQEDGGRTSIDSMATDIGTIGHAFMYLHYTQKKSFDTSIVKFSDGVEEEERAEAERVFRYYRLHHSPKEFGKVLHAEQTFPRNEKEKAKIEEAVGIAPYAFTPDLVVRLSRSDAEYLGASSAMDVRPGVYLVDHKFLGQWDGAAMDRYLWSHQFTAYNLGYSAINAEPIQGTIVNVILKYKSPEVKRLLVPFPTQTEKKALFAFWKYCLTVKSTMPDWPNSQAYNCFPKGKTCHWFVTGDCQRY